MRNSDSCNAIYYANDAMAAAEALRPWLPKPMPRGAAMGLDCAGADGAGGWIGAAMAWLTHPLATEEWLCAEALVEVCRLRREAT